MKRRGGGVPSRTRESIGFESRSSRVSAGRTASRSATLTRYPTSSWDDDHGAELGPGLESKVMVRLGFRLGLALESVLGVRVVLMVI